MKTKQEQEREYRIIGIILLVFFGILYAVRIPLSVMGIDTFLFIDNLVEFNKNIHPAILWGILGIFIGLLYGTFTAWRKYRLEFKLNLIPLAIFTLFIVLLILINKPFETKAYLNSDNSAITEQRRIPHYYYKITASKAYIYSEPSAKSQILSKAGYKGAEVEVVDFTNDKWWKVRLYNTTGYIKRGYLKFLRTDTTMQSSALEVPSSNPPDIPTSVEHPPVIDSVVLIDESWKEFWGEFTNAVSSKDKSKIAELASANFTDNASVGYSINDWATVFDNDEDYNRLLEKLKKGVINRGRTAKYLGDEAGDEIFDYENGKWSFAGVLGD